MKISVLEPLFVSDELFLQKASDLVERGCEFELAKDRSEDEAEIIRRGEGAEIIVTGNLPLTQKMIESWPELKFLPVAFTGLDHVPVDFCKQKGIKVVNSQGYAKDATAELSLGLMLSVLRNLVPCDKVAREGKTKAGLVGSLLKGKTVGIVGTGEIGLRVAELCKAFGCKLTGYSRTEKRQALGLGLEYKSLRELMEESDIISLHLPLTPKTKLLLDKKMIDKMRPGSILINCARGAVLDSDALAEALNEGRVGGAGIDVFETEPPLDPSHPLLTCKNAVVAPHVAFASRESFELRVDIVLENIRHFISQQES